VDHRSRRWCPIRPGRWHAGGVHELIALLLPGGDDFVAAVQRAWAAGDAVLPLDPSAPQAHLDQVVGALAPTAVVEADGEVRSLPGGRPVDDGDALVIATSGTTGAPKGAVHTHGSIEHAAFATSVAAGVSADTWWLACLPLSHVGGFSVVSRALLAGARLEVHPRADAAAIDDAAARGATHVSLVPTLLTRIDPGRWRTILLGGSSIPTDRPGNSIATYGMTETMGGVVYDGLALNGVEMRIIDPAGPTGTTRAASAGVLGPIELRSPTLLRCYRDGTDPVGRDGWFRTGDLGRLDPLTRALEVHGRADDLIISGGEKVWPEPVEAVLRTDHRVHDVAVVGRPDPEWGQRVVAVVVPRDPLDPPTLEGLRDLVRTQLPRAAAPKVLELTDSLPRTGLGKIRRSLLVTGGSEHPPHG
jgi:O-succinylbenzoic acid--CoA ligase